MYEFDIELPLSSKTLEFLKQVSARTYLDFNEVQQLYQEECTNPSLIEDEKTDGQVFILPFQNFTIIAFRGSELKRKDWATNFKFWPIKTPYGYAHYGFATSFLRLWPQIKIKIDSSKPIVVAGHSLGGALAQLCTIWCKAELDLSPAFVVTFGQPRVGLSKIANAISERMAGRFFRINHIFDPVPKVPPYLFFFRHPKTTGFKRLSNGTGRAQTFFERNFWEITLPALITVSAYIAFFNHSIANY